MKMKVLFFIIYISKIFIISPYTFEPIKELIPKTIIFNSTDLNPFKIFEYTPSCPEKDYKKDIYLQSLSSKSNSHDIYIYDNFSRIAQNSNSEFINFIEHNFAFLYEFENSFLFSNLKCETKYYFVISLYKDRFSNLDYPTLSGMLFNIIDAKIDIINLSPGISDIFSFQQRNETQQEIIFYSHIETRYGLINFGVNAKVQIFKNNEIIYETREEEEYKKEILLEKNENYTIYFMGNYRTNHFFSLQLFKESSILRYDFKNGPIALYYSPFYYFEIDISEFEINDIILLDFYSSESYSFKYQYINNFKENNFNCLGRYDKHNYIPIKKKKKDSSLIISIEMMGSIDFIIINLIRDKIEEINYEFKQEIKGPKYYFIDYFKFNEMNSIGFLANESFLIYEENTEYSTSMISKFDNIFITTLNNYAPNIFKSAIIYFNTSNDILFEIKKYNYSFLNKDFYHYTPNYEYFQLCQGNDTLDELYFYLTNYDIFQPVFGAFDSYFIKITDIKNLSDLNFDKIEPKSYYALDKIIGFLKIKCSAPLMLKHLLLLLNLFDDNKLNSGQKYYINLEYAEESYTFDESLINKDLQIKITILGLKPNQIIKFFFNYTTYNLTNKPFELNFTYENYVPNLFNFEKIDKNIDNIIIAEINVGLQPEKINEIFKQIDFIDSFGALNINNKEGKEGIIIKIPNNFTYDLFDFSIYFKGSLRGLIYVDISYDKLEFQTICYENKKPPPSVPLFRINPYDYIKNNFLESNNKFFFILIYSYYSFSAEIYIKKPKLYSDVKFNTINYLPELTGNNSKYYYQIPFPKNDGNYNYLCIQMPRSYAINTALSKQNIQYHFVDSSYNFYNDYIIHYSKNNFDYFNYDTKDNPGYINFIQTNESVYPYINSEFNKKYVKNIQQINGKNKLRIDLDSLSYKYNKNIVNYYIFINFKYETDSVLYSTIIGQRKPNEKKHQFMTIIEDKGLNETISKQMDINIDIYDGQNNICIIPIFNKTNLFLDNYICCNEFNYQNKSKKNNNKKLLYILIPIISVIIISIIILLILRHRKKTHKEITVDKILDEELTNIEK